MPVLLYLASPLPRDFVSPLLPTELIGDSQSSSVKKDNSSSRAGAARTIIEPTNSAADSPLCMLAQAHAHADTQAQVHVQEQLHVRQPAPHALRTPVASHATLKAASAAFVITPPPPRQDNHVADARHALAAVVARWDAEFGSNGAQPGAPLLCCACPMAADSDAALLYRSFSAGVVSRVLPSGALYTDARVLPGAAGGPAFLVGGGGGGSSGGPSNEAGVTAHRSPLPYGILVTDSCENGDVGFRLAYVQPLGPALRRCLGETAIAPIARRSPPHARDGGAPEFARVASAGLAHALRPNHLAPWLRRTVCVIHGRKWATGVVIAPHVVLTVAHAVDGGR